MKLKRLIVLIFSIFTLFTASAYAYRDGIENSINISAVTGTHYEVESVDELEFLLDISEYLKKSSVGIIVEDEELKPVVLEKINSYITENDGVILNGEKSKVTEYPESNLYWADLCYYDYSSQYRYNILPKISSAEDLYNAVQLYKTTEYELAYLVDSEYLSLEQYSESGVKTLISEVLDTYGEDISSYVGTHIAFQEDLEKYILLEPTDNGAKEHKERYRRILTNNTIVPITDDMTELEKLTIILNSASNVYNFYIVTGISVEDIWGKEHAYSMGVGQCHHYAKIVKELCDIYGIPCHYVLGKRGEIGHAWNAVQYNGTWYMVDTTGSTLNPLITSFDQLSIYLVPSENLKSIGYEWDEEDYPVCTEEFVYGTDFEYIPEITPTTEKIALFEPYKIVDPIAGGVMIRCNVWFDKANGKILGFDTNLAIDSLEKVDGDWIKKEVYFEIPSEIDGVKVQSIGSFINWDRNIGTYDKIIIPDNITIDEYAFARTPRTTMLEIGDNVTAGYNSLPSYKNIVVGENFIFKGFYASKGGSMSSKLPEIIYNDELLAIELSYNEDEDITVESEDYYHSVTYASGMNIVDEVPTKTLTVADDILFIDPRLGRLNRRYVIGEDNPRYTSIDGVLYNKDVTELISVPIGVEELVIPDTVTKIGDHALEYNNALKSITFPEDVEEFGHYSFRHLSNIESVTFWGYVPESFKAISCSEFSIFCEKTTPTEELDYSVIDSIIFVSNAEYVNDIMAAFYDENNTLIEVQTDRLEFDIPSDAVSYSLMVWDENMKPLTATVRGVV